MKKTITLILLLILSYTIKAQDPAVQWQNTIGGSNQDDISNISPTTDGGYILGGTSNSNISGNKTENSNGDRDLWIVKTDETGSILWQNTIGGSDFDYLGNIYQNQDGSYFIIASSKSDISGDKTENSRGGEDFWILKLDSTGNIIWQHTYGGTGLDYLPTGNPTADGGLIVACVSTSGIGADRTEFLKGYHDTWVLKLDTNGIIEWQKSIGGDRYDTGMCIMQTPDLGYIIGLRSNSNISGDKTQNSYNSSTDYWIVKLDSSGLVLWDKTIGGNDTDQIEDIIITNDGGYLLGGASDSNISGDKTQNRISGWDYWLVKIDNNGNVVWDKTFGGFGADRLTNMYQLDNGNYLISGSSDSNVGGNKTEASKGQTDAWFLYLDASGNLIQQKIIGGASRDYPANIIPTYDGGFVVGATSSSNISGDKTEDSKGASDYWIFKMQSLTLGFSELLVDTLISVYPNPSNGNFTIDLGKEYTDVNVEVYNMLGQLISSEKYASAKIIEQKIKSFPGIYFVKVSTAKEGSKTLRIIKL